jgi:hypothetical protein
MLIKSEGGEIILYINRNIFEKKVVHIDLATWKRY